MASLQFMGQAGFDASQVAPAAPLEMLPPGDYNVQITSTEMKPTTKGDGSYLALTLEVLDGPCKGRKLWDNLNLHNPNPTAVEIAQRTLSAICHATGVIQLADSDQLLNKPMLAKVGTQPGRDGYEPSNRVKGYSVYAGPIAGAPAGAPVGGPPPFAQAQPQAPVAGYPAPAQPAQPYAPPMAQAPAGYGAWPQQAQQPMPVQAQPAPGWPQAPVQAPWPQAPVPAYQPPPQQPAPAYQPQQAQQPMPTASGAPGQAPWLGQPGMPTPSVT